MNDAATPLILADAATDAASQVAWAMTCRPSQMIDPGKRAAVYVQIGRAVAMRAEAEADPVTFVRALFDEAERFVSDYEYDLRK